MPVYCVIITSSGENNRLSLRCQKLWLLWPTSPSTQLAGTSLSRPGWKVSYLRELAGGFITDQRPRPVVDAQHKAEEPSKPRPRRQVKWSVLDEKAFLFQQVVVAALCINTVASSLWPVPCHNHPPNDLHLSGCISGDQFECVIELIVELMDQSQLPWHRFECKLKQFGAGLTSEHTALFYLAVIWTVITQQYASPSPT